MADPILPATASADLPEDQSAQLVRAFLTGRSALTLQAYRRDLEDFRAFIGAVTPIDAARRLLGHGHGAANALVLSYRAHLTEQGLAPATIQRRMSALRAMVRLGRSLGMVPWTLEVDAPRVERLRDTRGPGRDGFLRLLRAIDAREGPATARDRAMLRLLHDLALRRSEVVRLDLADFDAERASLAVLGKGRSGKEILSLPRRTQEALSAWVTVRGPAPGALFQNLDRARKGPGRRLTGTSLYRLVRSIGERVGLKVRPHGLRHAAITEALDRTNGDVRAVQRFSRHRDLRVLTVYDDNRQDLGGKIAQLISDD